MLAMVDRVRIAAIGFQHQHVFGLLDALLAREGVELVAIAEADDDLRALAAGRYPVTAYADYREMLEREKPRAAVLAPVNSEKPAVIAECAARGVHVYADKPMATTLEGNELIASAIRRHGTIVYMAAAGGYGDSAAYKRLIDDGALGRLVQFVNLAPHRLKLRPGSGWTRPAWSYRRAENGGPIVDVGVHAVNTWRFLSGQEVAEVSAQHANKRFPEYPELEDHAAVFMTMTDGSTAFLGPSWLTPDADPSHGRYMTVLVGTEGQLEVLAPGIADGLEKGGHRSDVILTTRERGPHRPELPTDGLSAEDDFLAAVREGRPMRIGGEFLVESQRVALVARDAADQGRAIRLR
jgi:predicted dehydrogenase